MTEELTLQNSTIRQELLELIAEVRRRNLPDGDESATTPDDLINSKRLLFSALRPLSELRNRAKYEREIEDLKKTRARKELEAAVLAVNKGFSLAEQEAKQYRSAAQSSATNDVKQAFTAIREGIKSLSRRYKEYNVKPVAVPEPGEFRAKITELAEEETDYVSALQDAANLEPISDLRSKFDLIPGSDLGPKLAALPLHNWLPLEASCITVLAVFFLDYSPKTNSNALEPMIHGLIGGSIAFEIINLIFFIISRAARRKIAQKRNVQIERTRAANAALAVRNLAVLEHQIQRNREVLHGLNRAAISTANVSMTKFEALLLQVNSTYQNNLAPYISRRDEQLLKLQQSHLAEVAALDQRQVLRLQRFSHEIERIDALLQECLEICDQSLTNWLARNVQMASLVGSDNRTRTVPAPRMIRIGSHSVDLIRMQSTT